MTNNLKCLFVGSKQIGLSAFKLLAELNRGELLGAVTVDDSDDSRSVLPLLSLLAAEIGSPLARLRRPEELAEAVDRFQPDFVLVVGWYWLIPPQLLNKVPAGFYGVHASPLPAYRGAAPVVWQIINGEPEIGVSLFLMDAGMDTGDIVDQRKFPLDLDQNIAQVLVMAEKVVLDMLRDNLPDLLAGRPRRIRQSDADASYCSARFPKDGLIDWRGEAEYIHNFIRAQSEPYPGAFCFRGHEKITIWRARSFTSPYFSVPGRVGPNFNGGVAVGCGRGAVVVETVGVEGRILPATDVLRFGETLTLRSGA